LRESLDQLEPAASGKKREQIARDHKIWIAHGAGRARAPGYLDIELPPGADSEALTEDEVAAALRALLRSSRTGVGTAPSGKVVANVARQG